MDRKEHSCQGGTPGGFWVMWAIGLFVQVFLACYPG